MLLRQCLDHRSSLRSIKSDSALNGKIYSHMKYENNTEKESVPELVEYLRDKRIVYSSYISSHKILHTYGKRRKIEERIKAREKQKLKIQSVPLIIERLMSKGENQRCETPQNDIQSSSAEVTFPYSHTENIDFLENPVYSGVGYPYLNLENATMPENIAYRMHAYEQGLLTEDRSATIQYDIQDKCGITGTSRSGDKDYISKNSGTADINIPVSDVPCGGCGAHLHCQEPALPGFIPKELFLGLDQGELRSHVCQRCYFLKHRNMALNVRVSPDVYPSILKSIQEEKALAIVVVDLLDVPCSIWPGIMDIIGYRRPVVIVGNKVDLLPADGSNYLKRIEECLISAVNKTELGRANIKHTALVSAHTGYGVERLITKIQNSWGVKGDVYILGCTNSGKSTLFNALLGSDMCKNKASDLILRATTSPWPGTTLNMLKFPILRPSGFRLQQRVQRLKEIQKKEHLENKIKPRYTNNISVATLSGHIGRTFEESERDESSDPFSIRADIIQKDAKKILGIDTAHPRYALGKWCYDTPGTVQPDQIINLLTHEELLKVLPKELIRPRSFSVTSGKSLFLGGLARLDILYGPESLRLTVFASEHIPINIVETVEASAFYRQYLGSSLLGIPIGIVERLLHWPVLKPKDMRSLGTGQRQSCADVVLSSAGWIAITGYRNHVIELRGWTPGGRGIHLREPSMFPHAVNLKGDRIGNSPAYKPHKLFVSK